jgi:NAD(P)-dependent dehydrogenase (short-subunit alcohol dehydrogenase family)
MAAAQVDPPDQGRLDHKVVLVTGGDGGIGAETVRRFAREGATVVAADLQEPAGLADPGDGPPRVHRRRLDVTDEGEWDAVVGWIRQELGRLDALVHTAGIATSRPLLETSLAEFQRVFDVNATGTFLGIRAVAPLMTEGGGGSIVTLSSINGLLGATGLTSYSTSKFAVRGLTKVAALELAEANIRVNAICPGSIATPITDSPDFADKDWAAYTATIPLGRRGAPADVAELALYLASDAGSYVTGTEITVDGGIAAGRRFPKQT